jgi:hypothetical protein
VAGRAPNSGRPEHQLPLRGLLLATVWRGSPIRQPRSVLTGGGQDIRPDRRRRSRVQHHSRAGLRGRPMAPGCPADHSEEVRALLARAAAETHSPGDGARVRVHGGELEGRPGARPRRALIRANLAIAGVARAVPRRTPASARGPPGSRVVVEGADERRQMPLIPGLTRLVTRGFGGCRGCVHASWRVATRPSGKGN